MHTEPILLSLILLTSAGVMDGQDRGAGAAPAPADPAARAAFIRENYTKFNYHIPMRDGVKLFTSVYVPKDVFSEGSKYPIMMQRTGYSIGPYGIDQYPNNLGPSELFVHEKFIFAYQDIRGRCRLSEFVKICVRVLENSCQD